MTRLITLIAWSPLTQFRRVALTQTRRSSIFFLAAWFIMVNTCINFNFSSFLFTRLCSNDFIFLLIFLILIHWSFSTYFRAGCNTRQLCSRPWLDRMVDFGVIALWAPRVETLPAFLLVDTYAGCLHLHRKDRKDLRWKGTLINEAKTWIRSWWLGNYDTDFVST